VPLIWREVRPESLPAASRAASGDVESALAGARGARAFRSAADAVALLFRRTDLAESPGVTLELEETARQQQNVAFLVRSRGAEDVGDLAKYSDTIALPEAAADPAPRDMVRCGRATIRSASGEAASFVLFRNAPADAERLGRGAPRGLAEPDDNLPSREDWFEKRHGER